MLWLVRTIFQPLYAVLFAWWLTPLLRKKGDREFGKQIDHSMAWLWIRHDAMVIPNAASEYGPGRLSSLIIATVSARDVLLQFVTHRGELILYAAPKDRSRGWTSLPSELYDPGTHSYGALKGSDLADVADVLDKNWDALIAYVEHV